MQLLMKMVNIKWLNCRSDEKVHIPKDLIFSNKEQKSKKENFLIFINLLNIFLS